MHFNDSSLFYFQNSWLKSLALTAAQWMEKNVLNNRNTSLFSRASLREYSDINADTDDEKRLQETENLLEEEWGEISDETKERNSENYDDSDSENNDFL